jgi:hypothetical protein
MSTQMISPRLNDSPRSREKGRPTPRDRARPRGVVTGTVVRIGAKGDVFVRPLRSARELPARSIVSLSSADIGREVVLAFDRGHVRRPIILGCLRTPDVGPRAEVTVDGETIVLTGQKEVSLRCGKSSITLTQAGKVLINGAYLLSRSTGVNRIKGGSVQIN